jgi:hypothetical protein
MYEIHVLNNYVLWDKTLCRPLRDNRRFSGDMFLRESLTFNGPHSRL